MLRVNYYFFLMTRCVRTRCSHSNTYTRAHAFIYICIYTHVHITYVFMYIHIHIYVYVLLEHIFDHRYYKSTCEPMIGGNLIVEKKRIYLLLYDL